jgi:hypothetical protein
LKLKLAEILLSWHRQTRQTLYSGTHSGDAIEAKAFPCFEQKLSLLLRHAEKVGSEYLKPFAADMIELITAGKSEGNQDPP